MCTASIRVDRFSDSFLQPLTSSSDFVVVGIDFISGGARVSRSLLPPRGGEETFFRFATTANTWRVMRIVDWAEIASDLVVSTYVLRINRSDVHIYLSPPTRYTCLICPTVFVVDAVRIHRIHDQPHVQDGKPRFVSAVSITRYPAYPNSVPKHKGQAISYAIDERSGVAGIEELDRTS